MNAILYARYSPRPEEKVVLTPGQSVAEAQATARMAALAAADRDSIQKQIERCRAYCVAQDYTVAGEHEDADLSGARADNRPGLQAALEAACRMKAVLVVYDLSRLARDTRDALNIAERLEKSGAHLAMLDMKIDTSSPTGKCFFTIMAAFATLYREQISERTAKAMRQHQARGRRMGRADRLPWGWQSVPSDLTRIVPAPRELEIVAQVKLLHSQGMSYRAIARQLDAQGVTCRGQRWHHQMVRRLAMDAGFTRQDPASNPPSTRLAS